MPLTPRVVTPDELTPHDITAWSDLARRAAEPNVFYEPEVLLPAMRHLAPAGAVRLAIVEDAAGRWVACAPVRRVRAWGRLRLPCLTLWAHDYCGLEVPLVDAASVTPALSALLGVLRSPRGGAFITFTQLPQDGPVRDALRELTAGREIEVARYERAVLRRRPEFTYLDGMKGKRRSELSRSRRRLEERHEGVETVDVSDRDEAVEWFLRLEAAGWKGAGGTALAIVPGATEFFREACATLRRDGRLEMLALVADGRPIAMKCNFVTHGRMFGFKQAFDESMRRYSPGKLLDIDTMRAFQEREGIDMLDTIASAENASINGMWPDRRELVSVLVPVRGPVGSLARTALVQAMRRTRGHDDADGGRRPAELPPEGAPAELMTAGG